MNIVRWLLAGAASFAVLFALELSIHGNILSGFYSQTASLWRPQAEMEALIGYIIAGELIFAFVFAWIYAQGYEPLKSGLGQGIRFGILIGLLVAPTAVLMWYVILPIPGELAFYWFLAGMVESIALGIVTGLIYKHGTPVR